MRLIAGALSGRRLVAPRGKQTRPTSDRVREALFSMLEPLEGLVVLDLYAGSGAMALEALSRGASRAVIVESGRAAVAAIRRNVQSLDLGGSCELLAVRVERAIPQIVRLGPYDLIIADPPYADVASGRVEAALQRLLTHKGMACPGRLVLEHAHRDAPPAIEPLELVQTRRYGDTAVSEYCGSSIQA